MERFTPDKYELLVRAERNCTCQYTPPTEVPKIMYKYNEGSFICRMWDRQLIYIEKFDIKFNMMLS